MIENKDIAPGAVTEPKLSKNLRLKLANLEKGQSAQLPIVQSDGSMAYKAIGGDATLADDGTLTVTTTTTTTGETVQGPAGPAGVAGPAGATGAQGATGPAGSDANVTAENVDGALGFTGSTAGFVKRTGDNAFDIDTTVYESAFSKNTAFNKDFGTAAGDVCQGNDSRLSDSRTPNAHKASHATGAADAIAPSDIGAEPAFTKNTAHNKNFGSTTGTVCQGNDSRLSDARTPVSHNHDDRYYTETETDYFLSGKADSGHNHDGIYSGVSHTHNEANTVSAGFMPASDKLFVNNLSNKVSVQTTGSTAGFIGINDTSPSYQLDVNGTARFTSAVKFGGYTFPVFDGDAGKALVTNGSGSLSFSNIAVANVTGLGDSATKDVGTGSTNVAAGDHTHSTATDSVNGFMSSTDKDKLDGIDDFANLYVLPEGTTTVRGGYTIEELQDIVGAMFTGNTETNITATYQDTDGTIDLVASASGSGSGTVNSGTETEVAIYKTSTNTVDGTDQLFVDEPNDQVTVKNELQVNTDPTSTGLATNSYPLYVNGNIKATALYDKSSTSYYLKPAGDTDSVAAQIGGALFMTALNNNVTPATGFAGIFSKLDSSTNPRVFASDGSNISQISPHDEHGNWIHNSYSFADKKRTIVNMTELVKAVEELAGRSFTTEEFDEE